MRDTPDIAGLARALFGVEVAVATADIGGSAKAKTGTLFPQERAAIARATPARQQEFTAGRHAARLAMGQLGAPLAAVEMGADRAPIWPAGLVGSISHSGQSCIAVVARKSRVQSLGIDIEPDEPLSDDLTEIICSQSERAWLGQQPMSDRGRLAKAIFSAKESTYKCQYPLSRMLIDFSALTITLDPAGGRFDATFARTVGPFTAGTCLGGRYGVVPGMIVSVVVLCHPRKTTIPD